MDILSRSFEYTFSWDLVGERMCHGIRLGGLGDPGPCGSREETLEDFRVDEPLFWEPFAS